MSTHSGPSSEQAPQAIIPVRPAGPETAPREQHPGRPAPAHPRQQDRRRGAPSASRCRPGAPSARITPGAPSAQVQSRRTLGYRPIRRGAPWASGAAPAAHPR